MKYRFLIIVALLAVSTWVDFISILTYVGYELQLSAVYVALVSIAMLFPQAFLSRQLARVVKVYGAQQVMVLSTLGRIICTISLVWIDSVWVLLIMLLARSFFLGLLQPIIASQAKEMAHSQGGRFASILNMINSVAKVAAPSVGGVISVLLGEKSVFILSSLFASIALFIILKKPLNDLGTQKDEPEQSTAGSYTSTIIPFSLVILFISGISAMYTNLIPYAFNFYSIPKITLSIALSTSAASSIVFNLYIINRNPVVVSFPYKHFFLAWLLSAIFFLSLSFSLLSKQLSLFLMPTTFACLSIVRTYFEVFANSYIYSLDKDEAISMVTYKQSLVSMLGIVATISGAIGFTVVEPLPVLISVAGFSLVASIFWIRVVVGRNKNSNVV